MILTNATKYTKLGSNTSDYFNQLIETAISNILPKIDDFAVFLTHCAFIRGRPQLALGLAHFCFNDYYEYREFNQPYIPHPCNTSTENIIRLLLF